MHGSPARPLRRRWQRVGAFARLLATTAVLTTPALARAGGFEIPDTGARAAGRGGAMVAGVDDLTAMHYNPGALAKQRGTTFLYNQNLAFHRASFQRAPLDAAVWGVDRQFGTVRDRRRVFPLGLFAVVASDFGLENWTFAAGIYGPSAVGKHDYPAYGPQSFMLTRMDVLMAYYNVAAAWKLRDVFGIGVTVQYVDLIQMNYALVVDSTAVPNLHADPDADSTQLETELRMKDRTGATALVGLWYRPHRRVELGLSSRVVPVFLRPKGGVAVDKPTLVSRDIRVEMPLVLPATLRGGVRYIHEVERAGKVRRWFDLELDAVYENWSSIKAFQLKFDGAISGQELTDLRMPKNWRDTVSVRLGSDIYALPPYLTVRLGGLFETATQGVNDSHLDFPAFARGGVGAGFSAGAKGIYATVGYLHIFQAKREISEAQAQVFQQRPLAPCPAECNGLSGVPANAGVFRSSYDMLNLGIEFRFQELLAGRTRRGKRHAHDTPASPPPPTTGDRSVTPAPAEPPAPAESSQQDRPEHGPTAPAADDDAMSAPEPTTVSEPAEPTPMPSSAAATALFSLRGGAPAAWLLAAAPSPERR